MKLKLKRPEYILRRFFLIFLVAYSIYVSGDSLWGANEKQLMHVGVVIFGLLIILAFLIKNRNFLVGIGIIGAFFVLSTNVVLTSVVNLDLSGFSLILIFAIAMLFTRVVTFNEYYETFEDIVFVLSLAALAGFLIFLFIPQILELFPTLGTGDRAAYNLYLTTITKSYTTDTMRVYGLFREPAMFSIYIGLALMRQMFFVKTPGVKRCLVYAIVLFLTKSLTGYIAIVFLFVVWMLNGKMDKKKKAVLFAIVMSILYLSVTMNLKLYLFRRFHGGSAHSINSRMASIIVGLYVFATHFLFGAGATQSNTEFIDGLSLFGFAEGTTGTNMVTYLLSSFGIILGGLFVIGIAGAMKYTNRKMIVRICLLVFVLLLLCGEVMTYSCTMYFFMFYGISKLLEGPGSVIGRFSPAMPDE